MEEIWYDVEGFEGLYQYSNTLKFKGVERVVHNSDGRVRVLKEKILNTYNRGDYPRMSFCKNGKVVKTICVHVFFATKFIPNPDNKKEVNHKNGNKKDYSLENLEWTTPSENMKHAYRTGLRIASPSKGAKNNKSKLVLDLQTGIFYECAREAAEAKGFIKESLCNMLNGSRENKTSLIYA